MLEKYPYGFSYKPIDESQAVRGYMTSVDDGPIFDRNAPREENLEKIKQFLADKNELLGVANIYVGGWLNEDDGLFYLDASANFQDLAGTLRIAASTHQKSIYHLPPGPGEDGQVIWLSDWLSENPDFKIRPEIREWYKNNPR